MAEPKVGEQAPGFTLKSTSGDMVGLEQFSDFKREAGRAYGVLDEEKFFTRRAYFLVDKQGVLRWKHVEAELGHSRPNSELLAEIDKVRGN